MPKILVIEDDPVSGAIVKARLQERNYEVIVARTGEEGIRLAVEEMPDLILMDMVLPGMHGLEATIRLKKDPRTQDIPVFAVTAMSSTEFVQACYQDGICVFIKKPYDFKELFSHIRSYTQKKRKEKKILMINDDPALVTLMAKYLKPYHYRVISAPPRMATREHIREVKPDVILLDIGMLEGWGMAVFKILKKSGGTFSIPVILMASDLPAEVLKEMTARLGAEDYVSNLFEFDEVDRAIRKVSQK
ncbi:MAG: response regulator [Candidatus Aminicenantales bacterium]